MTIFEQYEFLIDMPRVDFCKEGLHYIPRIQYGREHPRQYMECIYKDGIKNMPVVIWIHGGGFNDEFLTASYRPERAIADLAQKGYFVACIEYRLAQHALFPACITDCQTAILYLKNNSDSLCIDPLRVALWGESAGAYIADMAGSNYNDLKDADVQAVVSFYAPSDLEYTQDRFAEDFIGGKNKPDAEMLREASPISYVTKRLPPFLLLHGDSDELVPYEESAMYAKALQSNGNNVELITVKGQGHGFFKGQGYYDMINRFLLKAIGQADKKERI